MPWVLRCAAVVAALAVAACDVAAPPSAPATTGSTTTEPRLSPGAAARGFVSVVETVEPVAERECRRRTQGANCDFLILVDDRPNQPPNAFQTRDETGRPVLAFTLALIADARNTDELAFVMGHEAAHHILGHLDRQQRNAAAGALIFAGLASVTGGTGADIRQAQELGAVVGARSYSKEFELEADELGTIIAHRAGYDVLRGAEFFARIPDPGNRFLGTHPPNAQRATAVRNTLARIGG
ncbi:M48 family metalloprotease [Aestuariivita sp.]|jgi:Zn-dependent protease with chaperone function|uniref:M48 family metalloprotease n=1 Tax=Aestuariivita sp. TaxID=1872407 RepID=UPI002172E3F4|nr:M48 family metalloprotease [Aestuariivita sp.]MCE8008689.1 M48 family metalloprotease [Aestuariivita sp.]